MWVTTTQLPTAAHRLDGRALPSIEARGQQPRQARVGAIRREAEHFAVDEIREHRVELLRLAALNLVGTEMPRPWSRSRLVPFAQERFLRAPRFAPTEPVAYGRVRGGHRLAIQSNELSQSPRNTRLGIGEGDAVGADAARRAVDAPLPIDERHAVLGPRQVLPGPVSPITHPPCPSPTA
jgi:hypothetical protein